MDNKITQALSKLLPADQLAEATQALEDVISERVSEIEAEFNSKLKEAYDSHEEEINSLKETAEEGYGQAFQQIVEWSKRCDEQKVEFEATLEESFKEFNTELEAEKAKSSEIELKVYDQANSKLLEMQEIMINKIQEFLEEEEQNIYESAKKEILNDPRIIENKIAIEKMAEVLSDYIGGDSLNHVNSNKLAEKDSTIEQLKGRLRMTESSFVKVSGQNSKLMEQLEEANKLISEATVIKEATENKNERKNRMNAKENARPKGTMVMNENEHVVQENNNSEEINENQEMVDLLVLSGL